MKPCRSASAANSVSLKNRVPERVQLWAAATIAAGAAIVAGTYRCMRRWLGLLPKSVTSVSAPFAASGSVASVVIALAIEVEEVERRALLDLDVVRDAVLADRLDVDGAEAVAVERPRPRRLRVVGEDRRLAQVVDVRPLLDLLAEVRIEEDRVGGAVPQLHARPRAVEAGERGAGGVAPLLRRLDDLAVGARAVPLRAVRRREARERHARVRGAGLAHVGVGAQQHARHH